MPHSHPHAFTHFNPLVREGLALPSRRNLLKAGLAGIAGLSVPSLLRQQAMANSTARKGKSVILLWMTGGASHIDTLDPKPDRPIENRGPFKTINTKLPGVQICEHLPILAGKLDQFTILRSVDSAGSNHEPNRVMQSGYRDAEPRENRDAERRPAIGSIVSRHHGPNHPSMPAYATFMKSRSHVAFAGDAGKAHDPFVLNQAAAGLPVLDLVGGNTGTVTEANLFKLANGVSYDRIDERRGLLKNFDTVRNELDRTDSMAVMDRYGQKAVDMLIGGRMASALDLSKEPEAIRERYGKHLWCQQAMLARRMVEAGTAFVTLDLSYHTASGTWDNHGDNIPPYGGIMKGLKPLLPLFDHLITTLVEDLAQRGKLDDCLVIAMGEFGRTPQTGTQASTDGRNHWPPVMSMLMAGGGFRHGQVIGATEQDGGRIKERPVTPGDLAATIYNHFGVPQDTVYVDPTGRPIPVVQESGRPIAELV
ncbi:DUF1501 domain-containing protein [Zavarzinella formosa]|uniref:DUF1501 domain-containing protein n=1 Tax=Zavarzinella formosa TaxID=360055 RepID=UPI000304E421|nr:DUF1501 domain-containing protein [Zavarzinella formosa]